jgi:4-alpha-glucanotransferase
MPQDPLVIVGQRSLSVDQGELIHPTPPEESPMKRISLIAAAAMLVAGTQLHAQATKQDTTKKKATSSMAKPAMAKPAAAKPAAAKDTTKAMKKKSSKKGMKKDTTAKKPSL